MTKTFIYRDLETEILKVSRHFSVVVLKGPRQSGKTTLCKNIFPDYYHVDLDEIDVRQNIELSPKEFLIKHADGLIIDEAQRYPEIFSYIKVVVDEMPEAKFILTGSSNFLLMEKVTESLAGRAALVTLLPFSLKELGENAKKNTNELLFKGGFPAVWANDVPSPLASSNYYNTYIERDVRQIINVQELSLFQIFIRLCTGRIGTEFNANSLSNEIGVSVPTIQNWLSVLEASYVVFRLNPFFQNIGKRLVKSPKIYFYDTALVCFLLGIENEQQLETHPLRGQIFENYVVLEFLKNRFNAGKPNNLLFYRDKSQHEIDIVQEFAHQFKIYEVKSSKIFNKSFTRNLDYLKKILGERIISQQVIYDGTTEIPTAENGMVNFRNIEF